MNYAYCIGFIVKNCCHFARKIAAWDGTKDEDETRVTTHILLFPPGSVVTFTNLVWISLGPEIQNQRVVRTGGCKGCASLHGPLATFSSPAYQL